MRNDSSTAILVLITLLYFSTRIIQGKPVKHDEDITSTIKSLRYDMQKVLHFIDHLREDVQSEKIHSKGDKSRSRIPFDQKQLNQLLADDESVIKATAKAAAQAVANSAKATLKTQKGVKQIANGLVQLKTCLETFEKTIKI